MASPLRFGLEIELHGIRLTFRKHGDGNDWWAPAVGAQSQEQTMIGLESILVPPDPAGFLDVTGNIQWQSDWGFRGVGDAHASMELRIAGHPAKTAGFCILELGTAAAPVDDHAYWISSRKAAKAFVAAMDHLKLQTPAVDSHALRDEGEHKGFWWFPLQTLVEEYNRRVHGELHLEPRFERFQLTKSPSILQFENGVHPRGLDPVTNTPVRWDAYVSFWGGDKRWADVQVNYQLNVRTLSSNLDDWIASWSSIWAESVSLRLREAIGFRAVRLDSPIGDVRPAPTIEMYRSQTYAAMWRRAREQVDAHFIIPSSAGTMTALIKGLLTYLLVASSITIAANGNSTQKNSFPQLPKTSPVSIAREIVRLRPALAPFFAQLAQLPVIPPAVPPPPAPGPPVVITPPGAPAALLPVERARLIAIDRLRHRASLTGPIGKLPTTPPLIAEERNQPPVFPLAPFSDNDGGLLAALGPPDPLPSYFNALWGITFGTLPALNDTNRYGFLADMNTAPADGGPVWQCAWAAEVNSSMPASAYPTPVALGMPAGGLNEIKMLFESRYGRCKLNVGFNPYHSDWLFNRSYKTIVSLLAGAAGLVAVTPAVDAAFADDTTLSQRFTRDAPIH
ncbi:hypothetical protein B0T14DRAFT_577070 [Immersiella caudata]|uniref:Uncharacterized protein n=1 Tax=Immersiella caudata TaxID=314043 RepID=A0AA40C5J9_9PEZI|nr:hypothetical protein B0T14DRAFT_577070 [Immersiella caudata]